MNAAPIRRRWWGAGGGIVAAAAMIGGGLLPPVAPQVVAVQQDKDADAALKTIQRLGGRGEREDKLPAQAPVAARFDAATDATLLQLGRHPTIGALQIADARLCTAKGWTALKNWPHLRRLTVEKCFLTPQATALIGQCRELRQLALVEANLTDAAVANLKELNRLEHLSLNNNPRLTDASMKTVAKLERLRVLYLANTAITDKGLWELKGLDGLRTLNVVNTRVSADAAERFADEMPNLRAVRR